MVNNTCLKALLPFLLISTGVAEYWFFSIYKSGLTHRSHTGVLLGGYNMSEGVGNICMKYNTSTELTPNMTSADVICQFASLPIFYHRAVWIKNVGNEYSFAKNVPVLMRDVVCWWDADGIIPYCSYNKGTDCESDYYYTAISCGCYENYYRNEKGCFKCPSTSTSDGTTSACSCEGGYYWGYNGRYDQYDCLACGYDEYSEKNSTSCTSCPKGTSTFTKKGQASCSICNSESGFSIYVMGLCLNRFTILCCCIGLVLIILSLCVIGRRCYRIKQARQREQDEKEQQRQQHEELRRQLALLAESKPEELAIRMNDLVIENKVTEDSKSHNHNQDSLHLLR